MERMKQEQFNHDLHTHMYTHIMGKGDASHRAWHLHSAPVIRRIVFSGTSLVVDSPAEWTAQQSGQPTMAKRPLGLVVKKQ